MNLCSEGHDEVCFEGTECPVCDQINCIAGLEDEINSLEVLRDKLNDRIEELEDR